MQQQYDEKNIRRRVYDALNVLMAMDIISKEKKEIRWKGLPSNAQHDIEVLNRDKRRLEANITKKRGQLQELLVQVCGTGAMNQQGWMMVEEPPLQV